MKKYLFFLITIGIFISPALSFAALVNQPDNSNVHGSGGGGGGGVIEQFIYAQSGHVNKIQLSDIIDGAGTGWYLSDEGPGVTGSYPNQSCSGSAGILTATFDSTHAVITSSTVGGHIISIYDFLAMGNDFNVSSTDCYRMLNINGGPTVESGWSTGLVNDGTWVTALCAPSGCPNDSMYWIWNPGPVVPSLSFFFPTSGTTTPPFSPWLISLSNLLSSSTYQVHVNWVRTNHTNTYPGGPQNARIFSDISPLFSSSTGGIIAIPKPDRNLGYQNDKETDDTWNAQAYLYDVSIGPFISRDSVDFTMLRYGSNFGGGGLGAPVINGTSTYIIPQASPTGTLLFATTTSGFAPISGGQGNNISSSTCPNDTLGLCSVGVFFFQPSTDYQTAMSDEIAITETRFPFSQFFLLWNAASSSLLAAHVSTTLGFTFPAAMGAPTTTIVIISPTILHDSGAPQAMVDTYFAYTRKTLWLGTAIGSIMIPFAL